LPSREDILFGIKGGFYRMAKNKDTLQSNLSGFLDAKNLKVTYISEKEGEKVYDLAKTLKRYDGLDVSITIKVDKEIDAVEEE
jgi:hypothetical protein